MRTRKATGQGAAGACSAGCAVLVACLLVAPVRAQEQELRTLSTAGLAGSRGVDVRVRHPAGWRRVPLDDPMALVELRGPLGRAGGVLQVGRGQRRSDLQAQCRPERAATLMQDVAEREPGTRVTDVAARLHEGRPAYEIRYERQAAGSFLAVRSLVVCLKDTQLLVSCGAEAAARPAVLDAEPRCREVLESVTVRED